MGYLVFKTKIGNHLIPSDDFTINEVKGTINVAHVDDKYDYPDVKELKSFNAIEKAFNYFEDIRTKL